jgi:hypothetical protein
VQAPTKYDGDQPDREGAGLAVLPTLLATADEMIE